MAVNEGVGKIMDTFVEMDDKMGLHCGFALNTNFINEHEELAKKLLKAHQESIKFCYTNPLEASKIFAEYYNVPEEVAMMTMYRKCVHEGRTLTWEINDEDFKHAYDFYEKYELVDSLPPIEDLVGYDIYEKANLDDFNNFIKTEVEKKFPGGMTFEEYKEVILREGK